MIHIISLSLNFFEKKNSFSSIEFEMQRYKLGTLINGRAIKVVEFFCAFVKSGKWKFYHLLVPGPIQRDFTPTLNGLASCWWKGALVPYELDIEREC